MALLQLPAQLSKITTMSKGALRITVDTQENITDEVATKVMAKREKQGWFVFLEDTMIKEEDVLTLPPLPKDDAQIKSPSQILRNRMFVYYKETHTEDKFNEWYSDTLDKIGRQYLEKLDK